MRTCTILATLMVCLVEVTAGTIVTLSFNHRSVADPTVVTLDVSSNQVAKLVSAKMSRLQLLRISRIGSGDGVIAVYTTEEISSLGSTNGVLNPIIIKGPVRMEYEALGNYSGFLTFEISSTDEITSASTAVVVPADASGPVHVVLESSQDFVTWTEAQPGLYGSSTQKRFFRVRAKVLSQ